MLDALSEQFHDDFDPGIEHMFSSLDGDVYAQGLTIGHRAWLDMGSEEWQQTPDASKAAAYQIATKIGGWDEARIKEMVLRRYKHLKESILDLTLESLKELSLLHPLHIEDVNVRKADVIVQRYKPPMEQKIIIPGESPSFLELGSPWSDNDPL